MSGCSLPFKTDFRLKTNKQTCMSTSLQTCQDKSGQSLVCIIKPSSKVSINNIGFNIEKACGRFLAQN